MRLRISLEMSWPNRFVAETNFRPTVFSLDATRREPSCIGLIIWEPFPGFPTEHTDTPPTLFPL